MAKQNIKKPWIVISVIALLAIIMGTWFIASFFRSTYTKESIPVVCARISAEGKRKANLFVEHTSDDLPGYSFWVANDGEKGAPQEIFAFRSGPLGRFYRAFGTVGHYEGAEAVGLLLFAPRDEEEQKSPLQTAIFYSANEERISLCRYTLKMNGVETTLEKEVYPGRDFIVTVPGIGKKDGIEMKLLKAAFYRADGSEVCTMPISAEAEEKIPPTA